jgi:hypothetical protein
MEIDAIAQFGQTGKGSIGFPAMENRLDRS